MLREGRVLRVDSVESLLGVRALFACIAGAEVLSVMRVWSPLRRRSAPALQGAYVAPLLIGRILRYAIGVLPDIYVLTCVDALLV